MQTRRISRFALWILSTIATLSASPQARAQDEVWQSLGSGMNNTVFAVANYDGDLVAGGAFTIAGGRTVNRIARWNGLDWQPLDNGMDNEVRALTVYKGELIAAGKC